MSTEIWRYIFASTIGTSHINSSGVCQDASVCDVHWAPDDSPILIALASDGAGSALHAEIGSSVICDHFLTEFKTFLNGGGRVPDISHQFVKTGLAKFREAIATKADSEGLAVRDFACTFLAAVIDTECGMFAQIGDGAIVIADQDEPDAYCWVFWPHQGEYANQTNFATDSDASEKIEFSFIKESINEVAVFTDGLQNLALHFESKQAHTPFFRPIFEWLRHAPDENTDKLSSSLCAFLNSAKVNDHTNDDKSLILATRRQRA